MLHRSKLAALLVLVCVWPALAWGQQEMRSATKGASTPLPITGSAIDADHNALDVKCLSGCSGGGGGGGTSATDDAAFTPGTDAVTPAGFLFGDVAPDSVNEGDIGVGRMSANRNQYTTIRDAAGNERGANVNVSNELLTNANTELPAAAALADDTANPTVPGVGSYNMCWDGTNWDRCVKGTGGNGAVDANTQRVTLANDSTGVLASIGAISTSVTPGTSAAHLGKAEDAAHTTGDTGVMALCVRSATPTDRSVGGTDGDYEPCAVDASGRVHVSANLNTIGGNAISTGIGATGTGVQRVAPVSSSTTGAAPPAAGSYIVGLGSGATGGFLIGPTVADSFVNINVSTATTTLLVTGVSGRHVRISALNLVTAGANNVALISGTGATCGTGTTGMNGGTTAASGWNFPDNGGIAQGSGIGTINRTNATGDSVCIVTSAATQLSGRLAYAIY